jgi:hypothetical protein
MFFVNIYRKFILVQRLHSLCAVTAFVLCVCDDSLLWKEIYLNYCSVIIVFVCSQVVKLFKYVP